MEREVPLATVRVASVFADKDKDEFDDGDCSILDKAREVTIYTSICSWNISKSAKIISWDSHIKQ